MNEEFTTPAVKYCAALDNNSGLAGLSARLRENLSPQLNGDIGFSSIKPTVWRLARYFTTPSR
ncbi:MAG TPA: hypothetical protein VEB86_19650 [Chryseosolibacter sp.]|nr:hypothetical protein [Chryseosolibacter sp.]